MKGRFFCCFLLIALQIVSLISEASRPFPLPPDAMSHPGPGEIPAPHSSAPNTKDSQKGSMVTEEAMSEIMKEEYDRGVNRIGSSPPSCDHKCYGCTPCEAIQVPSTNRHINLGLQYTNYEPESWQCKCGVYFYIP